MSEENDKLRAAIIATGVSEQIADHLVKIRDDVEGAYRSECERLRTETARLAAEVEKCRAEMVRYKKAVADQLHYDMKCIVSDTPENRAKLDLTAARQRITALERENAALRVTEADMVRMPLSDMEHHKRELRAILAERDTARREADRMRPVFEAAAEWRRVRRGQHTNGSQQTIRERDTGLALNAAVDAALDAATKTGGE